MRVSSSSRMAFNSPISLSSRAKNSSFVGRCLSFSSSFEFSSLSTFSSIVNSRRILILLMSDEVRAIDLLNHIESKLEGEGCSQNYIGGICLSDLTGVEKVCIL